MELRPYDPLPDDLRSVARVCVAALRPLEQAHWSARAGCLEWDALETLDHMVDGLGFYVAQLASRAIAHVPFYTRSIVWRDTAALPAELLAGLDVMAAALADVVMSAPPSVRAYHPWGFADPSAFAAMGCCELLIHAEDILQGAGLTLDPPREVCRHILHRLFPWSPRTDDAWSALRWCCGRIALPDVARLGPDWSWYTAPLSEWDGTIAIGNLSQP